jgi:hypothetical protein
MKETIHHSSSFQCYWWELFFVPVLLVGACTFCLLPVDLFISQVIACSASFYIHVFLDKEYHVEGSGLWRFAWFSR